MAGHITRAFGNAGKNSNFFLLKINFFYVLDRFDALISKIIFKNKKKYHFDAFRHEKHFEK
jgi:hypothetical protein